MNRAALKIVIIGRHGQIAWDLQRSLPAVGTVSAVGRPEIDLADRGSIREVIRRLEPSVLVNAAGYTAVDQAEAEPELAMNVNCRAPQIMAEEMKRLNGLFITYSSDYVFDGNKAPPYTESDPPSPLNAHEASSLPGHS